MILATTAFYRHKLIKTGCMRVSFRGQKAAPTESADTKRRSGHLTTIEKRRKPASCSSLTQREPFTLPNYN